MSPRAADVTALIERFDHLRNSGVCSPTTRALLDEAQALLAAMSTPPADDVREALDADVTAPWPNSMHQVWERLVEFSEVYRHERGYPPNEAARTRFLFAAFEVRPHGTVTEDAREDLAYLITAHRFRERGLRGAIGEPDLAVARPMADFLLREGYRPHGTVADAEVAEVVDPERTAVERFADAAADQFRSDLDYDGGEIKRRILTLAHVLAPDHPKTAAECAVCRDDEAFL